MGRLILNSTPRSRVKVDGRLLGYTPINGKRLLAGSHTITFQQNGHKSVTRVINLQHGRTVDINVTLPPIRVIKRVSPRILPRITPPKPRGPQARHSFSAVRLPRRQSLRIYVSDRMGRAGRHPTLQLRQLAQRIERETARLLGPSFSVRGVTRAWQRTVRRIATRKGSDHHTFYPRAVSYLIYRNILKGRSRKRVAQLLVKYEYRDRFKRIRN
jgi:hypothetical protein